MAVGDRIKRIRNMRKLTQKELGLAIGFDDKTADVRIAQYESGTRTPKDDMLKKIAEILDVNYRAIYEPTLYAAEDLMYALFELDQYYDVKLHSIVPEGDFDKSYCIGFDSQIINDFLKEWWQRKKDLADKNISYAEYMEWKVNWPQTADDCGKFEPSKKWRKE